jgi:hypothetical protein
VSFPATHVVGPEGAAAWVAADAEAESAPRLHARLPVQVLEVWGDWAKVRCENGWETWTDGRKLRPVARDPDRRAGLVLAYRPFAVVGAALAVLGAFLPWYRAGGASINAWDLPLWGLFANDLSVDGGPTAGAVLMLTGLAAVAWWWRPPALVVLLLACIATNVAIFAIARWVFASHPRPDLGFGVAMTLVGGTLVLWSGWLLLQPALERRA